MTNMAEITREELTSPLEEATAVVGPANSVSPLIDAAPGLSGRLFGGGQIKLRSASIRGRRNPSPPTTRGNRNDWTDLA